MRYLTALGAILELAAWCAAPAQCPNGRCQPGYAIPAAPFAVPKPMPTTSPKPAGDGWNWEYVRGYGWCWARVIPTVPQATPPVPPFLKVSAEASAADGLDEVNAARAARGLRPFARDESLSRAAADAAAYRAARMIEGHATDAPGGDFRFLPGGCHAAAVGCGVAPPYLGWLTCCTYEEHTTAGAAWCTGPDGRRWMHLFVK